MAAFNFFALVIALVGPYRVVSKSKGQYLYVIGMFQRCYTAD